MNLLGGTLYIRVAPDYETVFMRGPATFVYDADTTLGGSGGPVLDIRGAVVAVNAAILPEYGGSNLGVPVASVRALLAEAGFGP